MRSWHVILVTSLGLILVVALLIPSAPIDGAKPSRDSGLFLYMGKEILQGSVPYRDIWDHKPPIIYYINALGLFIAKGSRWGVWFIEVVLLYIAAFLSLVLIRQEFGDIPASLGTGVWLLSLPVVLEGGNFTEEFGLPFQFAALYFFQQAESQGNYGWRSYAIGAATAMAFLLKQNLIGVGVSILLFMLWSRISAHEWRRLLQQLVTMALGGALVLFPVGIYFATHGALFDLWNAMFRYNLLYISTASGTQILTIIYGIFLFALPGIIFPASAGWLAGILYLHRGNYHVRQRKTPLLVVSLVGLPIEFLLASVSGRFFPHYFIPWLPILGVLSAFYVYYLTVAAAFPDTNRMKHSRTLTRTGLLTLFLGIVFISGARVVLAARTIIQAPTPSDPVLEYITGMTSSTEYVLMWGAETAYNFLADRRSPTKYVYQYPIYQRGYQSEEQIECFLSEIISNRPRLIIDTSTSNPSIPPIDPLRRIGWEPPNFRNFALHPAMSEVFSYISSNYRYTGTIGPDHWAVYVYKGNE